MTPMRPLRVASGGRRGARPDHAQDGQVAAAAQPASATDGRRVAGDDDGLDVLPDQLVEALAAEPDDLVVAARPVRRARVVAEVDRALARQPAPDLPEHGQSADARVEEADGSRVAHRDLTT